MAGLVRGGGSQSNHCRHCERSEAVQLCCGEAGLLTWGMCVSRMSSHLFVRLRPPLRPDRGVCRMARADQVKAGPFGAAAQRLGLELSEHAIMLGRSGTTGAPRVGGSVRTSAILAFAIQGSSRFGDLGCLPDQTHIRSSREATAP